MKKLLSAIMTVLSSTLILFSFAIADDINVCGEWHTNSYEPIISCDGDRIIIKSGNKKIGTIKGNEIFLKETVHDSFVYGLVETDDISKTQTIKWGSSEKSYNDAKAVAMSDKGYKWYRSIPK